MPVPPPEPEGGSVAGGARLLGPFNLTFDQADLPGLNQVYALYNFLAGSTSAPSTGTVDVVHGVDSVTLDAGDTAADVQTKLDTLLGVGSVLCFDANDYDEFAGHECFVVFLDPVATAVVLTLDNDTLDNSGATSMSEIQAGAATPRLGRTLWTPDVGDMILEIFFDTNIPFANDDDSEIDLYYGDVLGIDPLGGVPRALWSIGALIGGGFNTIGANGAGDEPILGSAGPFDVRATGNYASSSADYTLPWGVRGRVRRARPFAVAVTHTVGHAPTGGDLDLYVMVASPAV